MAGMQLKEGEVTSTIYGLVSFMCTVRICTHSAFYASKLNYNKVTLCPRNSETVIR